VKKSRQFLDIVANAPPADPPVVTLSIVMQPISVTIALTDVREQEISVAHEMQSQSTEEKEQLLRSKLMPLFTRSNAFNCLNTAASKIPTKCLMSLII